MRKVKQYKAKGSFNGKDLRMSLWYGYTLDDCAVVAGYGWYEEEIREGKAEWNKLRRI